MLNESLPLMLVHRDKVQPAIVCFCFWSEMERRAGRADVHCSPKDVATGNIFSVDAHFPVARRIIERQLPEKRQVRFDLFLRRSSFFFVRHCGGKVVSKQPAARGFQKIVSLRSTARYADVERLAFSAVK